MKTPSTPNFDLLGDGSYYHFGLANGLFSCLIPIHPPNLPSKISILINVDRIPLAKSSKTTFWPILGLIHGFVGPFPIGDYCGNGKPASLDQFSKKFVREVVVLKYEGLTLNGVTIPVEIRGVVCDAPARSFVTGISGHTGKDACPKCRTVGKYYVIPGEKKGRIVFRDLNAPLRTHECFIQQRNPEHHVARSLFEDIGIDMVNDIPLDYMHLVCLAVVRKLLIHWFNRKTKCILLSRDVLDEVSRRLISLRTCITSDFARLPRLLSELPHWKATEFRQFLFYTGPIALKDVLPKPLYQHFLILHVAVKLMSLQPHCYRKSDYIVHLLRTFVKDSSRLYGEHFVTYNVHCLIHLPYDVLRFGPLDNFSCFPFENFLQKIKRKVRISRNPLSSLVKRLAESRNTRKHHSAGSRSVELSMPHQEEPLINNCDQSNIHQFKKFKLRNWTFTNRFPNNYAYLNDSTVFCINNITESNNQIQLVGKRIESALSPFYSYAFENAGKLLNINLTLSENLSDTVEVPVKQIVSKAIKLPLFPNYGVNQINEIEDEENDISYKAFVMYPLVGENNLGC